MGNSGYVAGYNAQNVDSPAIAVALQCWIAPDGTRYSMNDKVRLSYSPWVYYVHTIYACTDVDKFGHEHQRIAMTLHRWPEYPDYAVDKNYEWQYGMNAYVRLSDDPEYISRHPHLRIQNLKHLQHTGYGVTLDDWQYMPKHNTEEAGYIW